MNGWKWVPVEPTAGMLAEAERALDRTNWDYIDERLWEAMLAAAPTPPADAVTEAMARAAIDAYCTAADSARGTALDALRAALAAEQPQPEALGYATRLATSLWEKHYKAVSPHWRPLNDTLGVLTQIDNMTCRLVPPPPAAEPSDVTDAARYRWLRDHRGGGHAVVNGDLLEGSELDENIDAALRAAAAARGR